MATENLGRVLMNFTGDYDASKSYVYLDEVTYNIVCLYCRCAKHYAN